MTTMTVSEARAALPDVLNRVENGEEVTITRHGKPVAVVVRADFRWFREPPAVIMYADRVHDLLDAARVTALPESEGLTPERAEALIAEIAIARGPAVDSAAA